ncbi:hypothetical protein [Bordetella genomosp. 10]|uniref:hypothetical protein n=1 Tax=Bordetella genomosp. 10 TaxID=1416804 RepID=UPI0015C68B3D|nr:hypothetical protein [Bordetella genomosp. 10]
MSRTGLSGHDVAAVAALAIQDANAIIALTSSRVMTRGVTARGTDSGGCAGRKALENAAEIRDETREGARPEGRGISCLHVFMRRREDRGRRIFRKVLVIESPLQSEYFSP